MLRNLLILTMLAFPLFSCQSTPRSAKQKLSGKELSTLAQQLSRSSVPVEKKRTIIHTLGAAKNPAFVHHLDRILLNPAQENLWIDAAESLELLGRKGAVLAQNSYIDIRQYERDYYYIKKLETADKFQNSGRTSQEIYNYIADWLKKYGDSHPNAQKIKDIAVVFDQLRKNIPIEAVYSRPDSYLNATVTWSGTIINTTPGDNGILNVKLDTNRKIWILAVSPGIVPDNFFDNRKNLNAKGLILEFAKEVNHDRSKVISIPRVFASEIW